jgi:hypothetical protein
VETGFCETARDQRTLPDRHALTVESHADMPTLCLDAPASAKSSLARVPPKAFRPGMLEP